MVMLGRIARSLRARGVAETLKLCALQPYLWWRERRFNRIRLSAQAEFDREHSVNTGDIVYLGDLAIPGDNSAYGARYGPTSQTTFCEMITDLLIDHARFTFIDIGSGKGAVLLYASDWPFAKIIGVEFAPHLHEIARQNLASYRSTSRKCFNIEVVCDDAENYPVPLVPVVLYFSSPFGVKVMASVLTHIINSFQENPREGYLIYNHVGYYPDVDTLLLRTQGLHLLADGKTYRLYRIGPEGRT